MAYDQALAERIRRVLGPRTDIAERKMFGGVAFMQGGKMLVGIVKDELMVRVGPEAWADALARPHVRPMDFTGRPMRGFVYVTPAGCRTAKQVAAWIARGSRFVTTLKPPARRAGTRRASRIR